MPFTQASLGAEKPKVKSEGDFTARNFYTHKFALAAWAQGVRHGQTNAAVQGDIDRASLDGIQAYRDSRFADLTNVVVCVAGGLDAAELQSVVSGQLGAIKSVARLAAAVKLHPGNRDVTWDLDARHLVITWPIPAVESADFPALLVAAQCLNARWFSDPELQKISGMTLAGADLSVPEGNFFYVSASLRPGVSFADIGNKLKQDVRQLASASATWPMLTVLRQQLAESMTTLPDIASLKSQLPPGVAPSMVEGNIALQRGINEFRYGPHKAVLAKKLSALGAGDVQRAANNWLTDQKASAVTVRPSLP